MGRAKKVDTDAANSDQPKKTQREMIEEALASGVNAKSNIDIANWINQKYGEKMKPQHVATAKTNLLKEGGKSAVIRRSTGVTQSPVAVAKPATTGGNELVALVVEARQLAEKCRGTERLKQLLDVLG